MMRRRVIVSAVVLVSALITMLPRCWSQSPLGLATSADVVSTPSASTPLVADVTLAIPDGTYVYADADRFFRLEAGEPQSLAPPTIDRPEATMVRDKTLDPPQTLPVYKRKAVFRLTAPATAADGTPWKLPVTLRYQACSETLCYPPETRRFELSGVLGDETASAQRLSESESVASPSSPALPSDFRIAARTSGFLDKKAFLRFLAEGAGETSGNGGISGLLESSPAWLGILLVLVGGVALNLTPCVLPMIPVNLAIIGAGAQAASRRRGFLMGGIYGLGMALAYGVLGLVVVLGGGTFGAINSSAWFNLAIAVLFVVLSAAMLGAFNIDLSRFGSGVDVNRWKGTPGLLAGFMGVVTAVLAGACVAPVVIAVILLATRQYAAGNPWALLYPFVLGIGMGLPWPFAGAGLSFLPKPGNWMKYVKVAFALFFIGLGVYYGNLGVQLLRESTDANRGAKEDAIDRSIWLASLERGYRQARETGKPLLVAFSTPSCKTCHLMHRTTLAKPAVKSALRRIVAVDYEIANPDAPEAKAFIRELDVIGFPTYLVLQPTTG